MDNLKLIRGADDVTIIEAYDVDGSNLVLTGYDVTLRISKNQDQETPNLEIVGVVSGSETNKVTFTITDTQTTSLDAYPYHYDILLEKDSFKTISTMGSVTVTNSAKA